MDNPTVGNYNLVVSGNSIPFGPQDIQYPMYL